VIALTPDSGVVLYRVVAQRAERQSHSAMITNTFARRDGSRLLAFHRQAPA